MSNLAKAMDIFELQVKIGVVGGLGNGISLRSSMIFSKLRVMNKLGHSWVVEKT